MERHRDLVRGGIPPTGEVIFTASERYDEQSIVTAWKRNNHGPLYSGWLAFKKVFVVASLLAGAVWLLSQGSEFDRLVKVESSSFEINI